MILEVDLYDLVGESEHDGMLGSHPLLDVNGSRTTNSRRIGNSFCVLLIVVFKVRSEML